MYAGMALLIHHCWYRECVLLKGSLNNLDTKGLKSFHCSLSFYTSFKRMDRRHQEIEKMEFFFFLQ